MSSEDTAGTLTEENALPQDPASVAEQIASADTLPADSATSLREEQIQNAINFLSHPKVRASSKESKVSFLEKKGLTAAEIDEAFRRLPDNLQGAGTSTNTDQPRQPLPKPYPTPAQTSSSVVPYTGSTSLQQQQPQSLRWTQAVVGASVVAVGVYALKQMVGPYAAKLYRRLYGVESSAEKEKEEEKRVADVLATAIQSQTSELRSAVESLKEMIQQLDQKKEAPSPAEPGISAADLREELRNFAEQLEEHRAAPQKAETSMERELRELKSLVSQQVTEKRSHDSSHHHASPQHHSGTNGFLSVTPPAARVSHKQESPKQESPPPLPKAPQQSPSYMEVLEMLEKGETPPNVRTDINDQPPNPTQPPPNTRIQPKPKPWERNKASSSSYAAGRNGDYQDTPHTVITEINDQPSSSKQPADPWRPPPVPQASLRKSQPASSASSTVGDEAEA